MTIPEFKKWLEQFDEDTLVECVVHSRGTGYYDQGVTATTTPFNPDYGQEDTVSHEFCYNGHFEYNDYTNNPYIKETSRVYKKKVLTIGGIDQ